MKPITFVTPPSPFLLDERVFPSLGILKVAARAEQLGHPVEHLDLNGVSNYLDIVADHRSEIYAITATTPQMVSATKIAEMIRRIQPLSKIILGGPHATLVNAAMKKDSPRSIGAMQRLMDLFDVIVAGDGEDAIGLAVNDWAPRLIDADDPKTELFLTPKRLEHLPLPARHLIDIDSYHYQIDGVPVTSIIGQLGCPFGCNFCAGRDSAMLRRVRLRPTKHIIGEMRHIYHRYGIHGFMFLDDELNVNPKLLELLEAMDRLQNELKVEFRCRGFVKAELFTGAQAEALYRAGFRRVMCGFESGSDRILKNINKRATKEDNTLAMEIGHHHKLDMKALMSLGHPGESPETIRQTIDWLISVEPSDFDLTIITPYPGSPYYDKSVHVHEDIWMFKTNGDQLYMRDIDYTQVEDFYKGSMESYKSYVFTPALGSRHIVEHRNAGETEVRNKLGIPFYQAGNYEASMGMASGAIYRKGKQ